MSEVQLEIVARNFDLTPAIEQHLHHRFQPIGKHFSHLTTPVRVVLSVEKFQHIAEAHCHLPRKKDLHARAVSKDMYASIDELAKNLDQQAIKHKSEMKNHDGPGHDEI